MRPMKITCSACSVVFVAAVGVAILLGAQTADEAVRTESG